MERTPQQLSDLRKHPRLRLALPYVCDLGSGELRDISIFGVNFRSDVRLQIDQLVDLHLNIPRKSASNGDEGPDNPVRLTVVVKWCEEAVPNKEYLIGGEIQTIDGDRHGDLLAFLFNEATIIANISQEQLARESAYNNLAQLMGDPVCLIQDDRIVLANKAFADALGINREGLEGQVFLNWVLEDHIERWRQHLEEFKNQKTTDGLLHLTLVNAAGQALEFELRSKSIHYDSRSAVVIVLRDLTARKELEEKLIQAEKMRALGEMAGGVAHDFNNILTGILCCSSMLKARSQGDDEVYKMADIIEQASERAAHLVKQLLGFARRGKHQNVSVDLHATIRQVMDFISITLDENVNVIYKLDANPSLVMGDPDQLYQVILNLAVNARDALENGGDLQLETTTAKINEEECAKYPQASPGMYCKVTIADTGCGITDEVIDRIFEPFFTTKELGKGTGMGLPMVYGIITNHHGFIEVESIPNGGTRINFALPLASDPAAVKGETATSPERKSAGASGRILVVDDEEIVREMTARMLSNLGYEVVTAKNGQEAVERYEKSGDEIDLVLVDLVMPIMGGGECVRQLKGMDQDVRVILTSGHGKNEAAHVQLESGKVDFLQKPYTLDQLASMIQHSLSKAAPAR